LAVAKITKATTACKLTGKEFAEITRRLVSDLLPTSNHRVTGENMQADIRRKKIEETAPLLRRARRRIALAANGSCVGAQSQKRLKARWGAFSQNPA
jgi:hypothetical protein